MRPQYKGLSLIQSLSQDLGCSTLWAGSVEMCELDKASDIGVTKCEVQGTVSNLNACPRFCAVSYFFFFGLRRSLRRFCTGDWLVAGACAGAFVAAAFGALVLAPGPPRRFPSSDRTPPALPP